MPVHDDVQRTQSWVDAGLISAEQASAIAVFESAHPRPGEASTLPRWVEPLAYLGAALVAVALLLLGVEVWDSVDAWGRVAVAAVVTACLLAAGLVLRRSAEPAAQRASSFTWLLSLAGVASTVALLTSDVVGASDDAVGVVTASVTTIVAAGLYLFMHRALQQVGLAVAVAGLAVAVLSTTGSDDPRLVAGVLTAVGLLWLLATWAEWLVPPTVGWVIGSVLVLSVGLGSVDDVSALWSALGIAVAAGLVALAASLDSRWVLAVALVGMLVWIPRTVALLFEGSLAVPLAILATGLVALAVAVVAVRRRG